LFTPCGAKTEGEARSKRGQTEENRGFQKKKKEIGGGPISGHNIGKKPRTKPARGIRGGKMKTTEAHIEGPHSYWIRRGGVRRGEEKGVKKKSGSGGHPP